MTNKKRIAIIGAGAAGYFAAIAAKNSNPSCDVFLFEATTKPLAKVLVSGGGRCNVTHYCLDVPELIKNYPRGAKELHSAFSRFQVSDTIEWFSRHGVKLKTEADGRMFPITDSSETIANCLQAAALGSGVVVQLGSRVREIVQKHHDNIDSFSLSISGQSPQMFSTVIIASGGGKTGFKLASSLGHSIVSPVPSLFTFEISDPRLNGLSGISFSDAKLTLVLEHGQKFIQRGPVLITHWGLSGPAIIKLSALGARELHQQQYLATLLVNFLPEHSLETLLKALITQKAMTPKKEVSSVVFEGVPKRYWSNLLNYLELGNGLTWADISKKQLQDLTANLVNAQFRIQGKGVFKEEFVTCGGVSLKEVDFRSMQSRICPGLFFAGEVLDIDALTGGFNFQAAWTTGFIAGQNAAEAN